MLTEEQAKHIKEQIIRQIDSWKATETQKQQAKQQIKAMPAEELEQFLTKNKLIKTPETKAETSKKTQTQENCPFCLIVGGKISAYKIDENSKSIAVLEINPLSEGHSLIIPKQHKKIESLPSTAFSLAKKIAKRIKRKLKPEEISIQTAELFGHGAINIIPVYKDEQLEKKKASEQELQQIQEKLKEKPKQIKKTKTTKFKQLEKAPIRIP